MSREAPAVGMPTCDDDPRVLARALDALDGEPIAGPVLLADMSATDAVARLARSRGRAVRLLRMAGDPSVSDSRNRLVDEAPSRHVLFLDADALPAPGWAAALDAALSAGDDVALAGARILPRWSAAPPPLFTSALAKEILGNLDLGATPRDIPRVMGTSFALDRARTGPAPFRTELGRRPGSLRAGEEVGLSLDVLARGERIRYVPGAVVHHHVRPERLSWPWMLRRMRTAGLETALWSARPEDFPRRLGARDRAFQLLTTPAFLLGRLEAARR